LTSFIAGCLSEDKPQKKFKDCKQKGKLPAGDGINDATLARDRIAMGTGTDVAIESAK
jgi:cation transport ATPase